MIKSKRPPIDVLRIMADATRLNIANLTANITSGKYYAYLQVREWRKARKKLKARLKHMEKTIAFLTENK